MARTTCGMFDYSSLRLSHDVAQIRLLSFEAQESASSSSSSIRCRLQVFSLANVPRYAALSYVWGNTDHVFPLNCNGNGDLHITYNLKEALKYLQQSPWFTTQDSHDSIQWLWADAVCINQKDLEERKAQVLLMRRIYEQARSTFIWLEHGPAVDKDALRLIQRLHYSKQRYEDAKETRVWTLMSSAEQESYLPGGTQSSMLTFAALNTFLTSGWFSRLWTIQELAVSRQPVMLARDFGMQWEDFIAAMKFADELGIPAWVHGDSIPLLNALIGLRNFIQEKQAIPLLQLLVATSGRSVSDPRDRIYGLLGVSNGLGSSTPPDYTMSVEEVYMNFAQILLSAEYLDILSVPCVSDTSLQSSSGANGSTRLPSWVPDWRCNISSTQQPLFPSSFAITLAAKDSDPFVFFDNFAATPKVNACANDVLVVGDLLHLRGYRLSQVKVFGRVHEYSVRASGEKEKIRGLGAETATFRHNEKLCNIRSKKPYPRTGETLRDVYWQTLCAGQYVVSYADTKSGFEKWFRSTRDVLRFVPTFFLGYFAVVNVYIFLLGFSRKLRKELPSIRHSDDCKRFQIATTISTAGRKVFRTEDGHIGLGPPNMEKGDIVFMICGCRTPMVLRPTLDSGRWTLVGACYLHGLMKADKSNRESYSPLWIS